MHLTPASLRSTYRLVALDLDGTLLDAAMSIRPAAIEAIAEIRACGVHVMIVTGRHHTTTATFVRQLGLDLPAICCNGAYLYDFGANRVLNPRPLRHGQAADLLELVREYSLTCFVYADDFVAYQSKDSHIERMIAWGETLNPADRPEFVLVDSLEAFAANSTQIWKLIVSPPDAETVQRFIADVSDRLGLLCERSSPKWFDIGQAGNSKDSALAAWIDAQGISAAEVIAFGDNHNDIGMLRLAGMGVAMGNADAKVQANANTVIGHHDSDALSQALRHFVLGAALPD